MNHPNTGHRTLTRRTVIGAIPAVITAGLATRAAGDQPSGYVLTQRDRCAPLEPLSGDQPVTELYDWDLSNTRYSSAGTVDLQRPATSILFLYDGPDGVSLVMVHGELGGDSPGGSVTFEFDGLPLDGKWVVQDDLYDGPSNYDLWTRNGSSAQVDWTWDASRTDGGAFRGLGGNLDLDLTITPSFNQTATLYGQYYTGTVRRWQALSGSLDAPERHDLRLDEPVTISRGACIGGSVSIPPSDDGEGRHGEGKGHEESNGKGHERGKGEGHDHDDDHPSDGGNGREQADGNAEGRGRSNDRRGKDDDDDDDVEVEVGDDDDDDDDDDDVEVEVGDDDDDDDDDDD